MLLAVGACIGVAESESELFSVLGLAAHHLGECLEMIPSQDRIQRPLSFNAAHSLKAVHNLHLLYPK
jgi:hypothetical protein